MFYVKKVLDMLRQLDEHSSMLNSKHIEPYQPSIRKADTSSQYEFYLSLNCELILLHRIASL